MRKNEASQMAALAESKGWDFVRFVVRERKFRGRDYAIVIRHPENHRTVKITKPGHLKELETIRRREGNARSIF